MLNHMVKDVSEITLDGGSHRPNRKEGWCVIKKNHRPTCRTRTRKEVDLPRRCAMRIGYRNLNTQQLPLH